ncbi:MAG: hypothetical protein ISS80_03565 [Candidatus Cloacimonetes bacterium]|nr:hypothetical protein [Candidatus Cloacimonadota bacterium]
MDEKSQNTLDERVVGGTAADVDKFLGFEPGTFDHIPHYARLEALGALLHVREMEESHVFRPGLYYTVLSDLCRATEASLVLGNDISKKRIETFILTCVDALGHIETTNYHLFLREIGDAVLLLFSSFEDAYQWWKTMHSWLNGRDCMWKGKLDLSKTELNHFRLEAKTIIHAGEVAYSGTNIPVSAAINQVFKVEKQFRANELGITQHALVCARPVLRSLKLRPCLRCNVTLPGDRNALGVYLIDNYKKHLSA